MKRSDLFSRLGLVLVLASACATPVFAQGNPAEINPAFAPRTVSLTPSNVRIDVGQSVSFVLPTVYKISKLFIQAEGTPQGAAAGEVIVNGDKKADIVVPRVDPAFFVNVGGEVANSVQIIARGMNGMPGSLIIRSVQAVIEDAPGVGPIGTVPPGNPNALCPSCNSLPFPTYYHTLISNVSNRAIVLVNELEGFTNYRDYGTFLLPIKKAAVHALATAEANGDASSKTRPFALELLRSLDCAEQYLDDMFEREKVFQLSQELLSLREYIRDILD